MVTLDETQKEGKEIAAQLIAEVQEGELAVCIKAVSQVPVMEGVMIERIVDMPSVVNQHTEKEEAKDQGPKDWMVCGAVVDSCPNRSGFFLEQADGLRGKGLIGHFHDTGERGTIRIIC